MLLQGLVLSQSQCTYTDANRRKTIQHKSSAVPPRQRYPPAVPYLRDAMLELRLKALPYHREAVPWLQAGFEDESVRVL